MNITLKTVPVLKDEKEGSELLIRQEEDKYILLVRHDLYVMSSYAKEMLDSCDGVNTVESLIQKVKSKYGVKEDLAEKKIKRFVEYFVQRDIVLLK